MIITGKFQSMSQHKMLDIIGKDTLEKIKQTDSAPVFKAYVIGHEGEAEGKAIGFGKIVKTWLAKAIYGIYDKLKSGIKVFYLHNTDSSHENRESIGEVVGKAIETIKDKLSAIVITYLKPAWRNITLDVASMETDMVFGEGEADVDVRDITGIALGDGSINTPGFKGATLIAQVQAFVEQNPKYKKGELSMTLDEIKQSIKEGNYKPDEIFSHDEIKGVPYVENLRNKVQRIDREKAELRLKLDDQTDDIKKVDTLKSEKDTEIKKLKTRILKEIDSKKTFTDIVNERKLDEKQTKFVEKVFVKFDPNDETKLKEEMNAFFDEQLNLFDETLKIMGQKKEISTPGAGPELTPEGEKNYTDPSQNPAIITGDKI